MYKIGRLSSFMTTTGLSNMYADRRCTENILPRRPENNINVSSIDFSLTVNPTPFKEKCVNTLEVIFMMTSIILLFSILLLLFQWHKTVQIIGVERVTDRARNSIHKFSKYIANCC